MATETQAQIDRINTEVATQASKIAQLSTILDGKAAGGGGSNYRVVTGTFTPPADMEHTTIEHNLGVLPKVIVVYAVNATYIIRDSASEIYGEHYDAFVSASYVFGHSHVSFGAFSDGNLAILNRTSTGIDITSPIANDYGICDVTTKKLSIVTPDAFFYADFEYKYVVMG